ncbi:hypothetical protein BK022_01720 [Methylorubrum extorquens]|uniref:Uncharacterized protein n=1 Tax=Methylorubrum extorquens TaxID=408 RepID=A0A1S1P8N0_METEX|nr:hypothetical protein BK022_01720 [Methylorubrum extorquens]
MGEPFSRRLPNQSGPKPKGAQIAFSDCLSSRAAGKNLGLTRRITTILVEDIKIFEGKDGAGVVYKHLVRGVIIWINK